MRNDIFFKGKEVIGHLGIGFLKRPEQLKDFSQSEKGVTHSYTLDKFPHDNDNNSTETATWSHRTSVNPQEHKEILSFARTHLMWGIASTREMGTPQIS